MSIFNQMIRGGYLDSPQACEAKGMQGITKPRTFKENIQDQIAFHKSRVVDLEAVNDSLTPDMEKFIEAIQRIG